MNDDWPATILGFLCEERLLQDLRDRVVLGGFIERRERGGAQGLQGSRLRMRAACEAAFARVTLGLGEADEAGLIAPHVRPQDRAQVERFACRRRFDVGREGSGCRLSGTGGAGPAAVAGPLAWAFWLAGCLAAWRRATDLTISTLSGGLALGGATGRTARKSPARIR